MGGTILQKLPLKFLHRTTLIQYLLLYQVIDFFCSVFGVLFGDGLLLWFVCIASALFYVYACMYCFCFVLCICLYAGYVYVCELGGSFAGASSSLACRYLRIGESDVWIFIAKAQQEVAPCRSEPSSSLLQELKST